MTLLMSKYATNAGNGSKDFQCKAVTSLARILYPHQRTVQPKMSRKKPIVPTRLVIATANRSSGLKLSWCSRLTLRRGLRLALHSARDIGTMWGWAWVGKDMAVLHSLGRLFLLSSSTPEFLLPGSAS